MGMFDSLKVKMDLPISGDALGFKIDWKNEVFQTKDLDNSLNYYEIGEDRRLRLLNNRQGWFQDEPGGDGLESTNGENEWVDSPYHGSIRFYTGYCDNPDFRWDYGRDADQMTWPELVVVEGWDWWVEFQAILDDGIVRDIKMLPLEKTAIRLRLANSKEWALIREAEASTVGAKIARVLRKVPGWQRGVRGAIRVESALHSRLSRALYRIS